MVTNLYKLKYNSYLAVNKAINTIPIANKVKN